MLFFIIIFFVILLFFLAILFLRWPNRGTNGHLFFPFFVAKNASHFAYRFFEAVFFDCPLQQQAQTLSLLQVAYKFYNTIILYDFICCGECDYMDDFQYMKVSNFLQDKQMALETNYLNNWD
ncbi:hypothetical protein BDA99DRAFT_498244 [Phascolomyces articulosus]|uniref:Transmembrane protein n=1 Tax=Phascolomyces articulosus TaxID=60185 RepID=A0AAD5PI75_9FUNG|nr:hypothetical protein BDA99DRAFT_498244 [Phascolomyces articulosus]